MAMNEKRMVQDLIEIFDEEYEKRGLITPQNTAEKLTAKGYREQSEGEWIEKKVRMWTKGGIPFFRYEQECSHCGFTNKSKKRWSSKFCPECGAKMKGGKDIC